MNIEEQPIDNDWNVHLEIGITDVRTLHRVIDFALQNGYTKDKPELFRIHLVRLKQVFI